MGCQRVIWEFDDTGYYCAQPLEMIADFWKWCSYGTLGKMYSGESIFAKLGRSSMPVSTDRAEHECIGVPETLTAITCAAEIFAFDKREPVIQTIGC